MIFFFDLSADYSFFQYVSHKKIAKIVKSTKSSERSDFNLDNACCVHPNFQNTKLKYSYKYN